VKVLDLFAGLGSGTAAFAERGHVVVTTDIHDAFNCTVVGDILDSDVAQSVMDLGPYDFIWASPPCQSFTVMQVGRNWHKRPPLEVGWHEPPETGPKTAKAILGMRLVRAALDIIEEAEPFAWILENPRAKLRQLPLMNGYERRMVTLCQYGMPYMKPTDLWGGFPPGLVFKPACHNGDPCHIAAPRGSRSGAQGTLKGMQTFKVGTPEATAAYRRIPYDLSLDICLATEAAIGGRPLEGATLFDVAANDGLESVCDACGQCYDHEPEECGQPEMMT